MKQHVLIKVPLARTGAHLAEALNLVVSQDEGFKVVLAARPAPYARVYFNAKGGPDRYEPFPPLAREATLEAWHSNHRDAYYRCALAHLEATASPVDDASIGEGCRLSWNPEDILIDFAREWMTMLKLASETLPMAVQRIELKSDPDYLPPSVMAAMHGYASLVEFDAATKQRLGAILAPGFLRYDRIAEQHEGSDLVRYRFLGNPREGGDFGELWLRAGGREWTSLTLCALPLDRVALPSEYQAVLARPPAEQLSAMEGLVARCEAITHAMLQEKAPYLAQVWEAYMKSLPPTWLSPFRPEAAEQLARSGCAMTETEAAIVDLWCRGRSYSEIAAELGKSPGYIRTLISSLRKRYGESVVPYHREKATRPATG